LEGGKESTKGKKKGRVTRLGLELPWLARVSGF
jgi:hypothetical protein